MSTETGMPCPGCGRDLVEDGCTTDGCPGPATDDTDSSARALMGASDESDQPSQNDEQRYRGTVHDPATEDNPHRDAMLASAAESVSSVLVDDDDPDWHEMDDAERRARMRQTELDVSDRDAPHTPNPDAVSDVAAFDWFAFARRYGFQYAGQGEQSRYASASKLATATQLDEQIAGGGETFVEDAVAHPDVPLDEDQESGRLLFRSEVLE